ncbi:MAG: DoxX family membrane protein [Steroidobacter sp.]
MRITSLGHLLFAIGMTGLGLLSLIHDDFAMNWQPVPAGIPAHNLLAYASGLILFIGGIGLLFRRTANIAAFVLALFLLSWLVLLQFPRVPPDPLNEGVWLGVGETLELVTGTWMLCALLIKSGGSSLEWMASSTSMRIATLLFGLSLPMIGLSHFVYADVTASMVPAWLPQRLWFACLTGAGHIAAGVGIITGIFPRLAATLEAIMMSSFVLLVHVPGVMKEPSSRLQWTMLCVALSITGCAWVIAHAYKNVRWLAVAQLNK